MRKLLSLLCAAVLLSACGTSGTKTESPEPTESDVEVSAPVSDAPEETGTWQVQENMEPYEMMEIALLGTASEFLSVEEILDRAEGWDGFSVVKDLRDSRVIYGDRGETSDYVYLIIPALNTDIRVGRYNYYAGEITEVWLEESNAAPLIYVECGDSLDPQGKIEYVRHYPDGDQDDGIMTGLSAIPGKLRTEFHMGTVDITPYEKFDSSEVGFYDQFFFDTLCSFEEIKWALQDGGNLNPMQEMFWDGHAYTVYDMEKNGDHQLYAITYDTDAKQTHVLCTPDGGISWEPLAQG